MENIPKMLPQNIKLQIDKEALDFFIKTGRLITLNYSTHVYMSYPWFKLDVGSNMAEVFWNTERYPDELRSVLHGPVRKGSICKCSLGFKGLVMSDTMVDVKYPSSNTSVAWTGIHLENKGTVKIGDRWSSSKPTIIGHIDHME